MPRIGAYLLAGALVAALPLSPSAAFGLHIGPFHLGFPFFRFHHRYVHRRHVALRVHRHHGIRIVEREERSLGDRESRSLGEGASGPIDASAVLYPSLAIPSVANDIFRPDQSSPWPFGYDAIFRTAFAKSLPTQGAQSCQPGDSARLVVGRMASELRPDAVQERLLQRLGQAIGMASGALAKACPSAIPAQPVARLRLMQSQVDALSMAIDLIRPPLHQFEQSLDATQRARFAAPPSPSAASVACPDTPTSPDWSIDQISQSVQPGDGQREALSDLRETLVSAARDLDAHCPKTLPADPLARLESIEARLDASWRTMLGMQVALAGFESRLTDAQRTRFEAMNIADVQ